MSNSKIIKSQWKAPGAGKRVAAALSTLGDTLQNARGENGVNVQKRAGQFRICGSPSYAFPWSKLCFGFAIDGPFVTIKAGEIKWGINPAIEIVDTTFEITEDYQYIGAEATFTSGNLIGPSTNIALFRPEALVAREWFFQFRFTPGVKDVPGKARFHRVGKPVGNWTIGGEFA